MKQTFLELPLVQRICICIMALTIPVFLVLYLIAGQRYGAVYEGSLLFPTVQGEQTVYTGRVEGNTASFTVSPGPVVEYRWGDKTYGPYTVQEDPSAVPKNHDFSRACTGVVVKENGAILFRGGWARGEPMLPLLDANGEWFGMGSITYTVSGGDTYDENGNLVDRNKPSVEAILRFAYGPELSHRGNWAGFWGGLVIALIGIFVTLFADELFRYRLSFQIWNADAVEPTDLELFGRSVGAVAMVIMTLVVQIQGLMAIV